MDGRRTEDLQRMQTLFSRVNALESLRQALSSYVRKTGQKIVMDEEKDKDMVQSLLDFKASLDIIWEESFCKNESFGNTIKDSFEHLINLRQVSNIDSLDYCPSLLLTTLLSCKSNMLIIVEMSTLKYNAAIEEFIFDNNLVIFVTD